MFAKKSTGDQVLVADTPIVVSRLLINGQRESGQATEILCDNPSKANKILLESSLTLPAVFPRSFLARLSKVPPTKVIEIIVIVLVAMIVLTNQFASRLMRIFNIDGQRLDPSDGVATAHGTVSKAGEFTILEF
jgi:hypothetical protein